MITSQRSKDTYTKKKDTKMKVEQRPSYAVTHRPVAKENARNATKFEGRRFLGRMPSGTDVWVNFEFTRDSLKPNAKKTMKVWTTVGFDKLYADDVELADCRVSFGTGVSMTRNLDSYLRDRYNTHGKVTHRTLDYIQEMIAQCPEDNPRRSEVWGVCNMIYVGTLEDVSVHRSRFTLNDVLTEWNVRPNYG